MDDPLVTELFGFEGSLFDLEEMERLRAKCQQGCWFWYDDWQLVLYRDQQMRTAASIAEGERAIIEQAKEEAFLAWGL